MVTQNCIKKKSSSKSNYTGNLEDTSAVSWGSTASSFFPMWLKRQTHKTILMVDVEEPKCIKTQCDDDNTTRWSGAGMSKHWVTPDRTWTTDQRNDPPESGLAEFTEVT